MTEFCQTHQNKHSHHSWVLKKEGWSCSDNIRYPEFTTKQIKNDRVKYAKDTIQPFRGTDPSREFINAYPKQAKKMFNEKQLKTAKNTWKNIKGLEKYQD